MARRRVIKRAVLGCESSGKTREALRRRGIDAISVDLLPADDGSPHHHQGDLEEFLRREGPESFDLAIFHPPCTFLTWAANGWLYHPDDKHLPTTERRPHPSYPTRREDREEAAAFAARLFALPIEQIGLENPRGYLSTVLGPPTQTIQPYEFGHSASKATCFWLKGLPPLQATCRARGRVEVDPRNQRLRERFDNQTASGQNNVGPGRDRWKERSETYDGVSEAIAEQWGLGYGLLL